jgi:hypothetical protein
MLMASIELQPTDKALIELLEAKKQYRVFDLLQALGARGYSDSDIKETIAQLLHEHRIELTPDRQLRSTAVAA